MESAKKQRILKYYEQEGQNLKTGDVDRYYRGMFRFFSTHGCRNRILEKWLDAAKPSESFLDVGCELGYYVRKMAQKGLSATGIDISPSKIRKARHIATHLNLNCEFLVQNAEHLEFEANKFDWVLCTETLEHLLNDREAVKELVRVVKGTIIISVPQASFFWRFIDRFTPVYGFDSCGAGHLREYSVNSLRNLFHGSIQIESIEKTGFFASFLDRFLPDFSLFKAVICMKLKKRRVRKGLNA